MDVTTLTAKDVMTESVVTVREDLTLAEAAELLADREISGAPVLDAAGSLLGVISVSDVARDRGAADLAVRRVMTPVADTVAEDTSVAEMARMMVANHHHRLVVTRRERPVGIVSSMDLLKVIGQSG